MEGGRLIGGRLIEVRLYVPWLAQTSSHSISALCTNLVLDGEKLIFQLSLPAVRIIEPFPANVFGVPGTRHESTCIAIDDDKPPALVKFAIRNKFHQYTDIVNSERVYQTNVTKGKFCMVSK